MSDPETLLDIFEPPEGLVGHSAALVAMTAGEDFLEAAMRRFTGLHPRQRAELGVVTAYLLLDGHESASRQSVLPPGRIPGLHELQPRASDPNSLLHAKLVLLAFASSRTGPPVKIRLAVITANFTYKSAKQQLELVWTLDVTPDSPALDRADVAAAGEFIEKLIEQRFYQEVSSGKKQSHAITDRLDDLLRTAAEWAPANRNPRFIQSLQESLYEQIRRHLEKAVESPRNLLLCGSGFYESPSVKGKKPTVLTKLEELGVFTENVLRVALVEPEAAGAIAHWAHKATTDGWKVMAPLDASDLSRRLHAKFIYAGYLREGHASNGWLYLGSGNLSRRGLLTSGAMAEGNIECGVVLEASDRLNGEQLEQRLFWNPDAEETAEDTWHVGQVGDEPDETGIIVAPPILSAAIELSPSRSLRLNWRDDLSENTVVSIGWPGCDWQSVTQAQALVLLEANEIPTVLSVRDDTTKGEWKVPVADPTGRVCWQPPRFDNYADALAALLDFPIRPAEASEDDDEEAVDPIATDPVGRTRDNDDEAKAYALHYAAGLIEQTAALQRALPPSLLDDWLEHLDRMLQASFPQALVSTWREHRIDVFSHLRTLDFRHPEFTDKQKQQYFNVLDRAAAAWGLR